MKQRMAASKLASEAYKAGAELDSQVAESGIDEALYLLIRFAPPRSTAAPSA